LPEIPSLPGAHGGITRGLERRAAASVHRISRAIA